MRLTGSIVLLMLTILSATFSLAATSPLLGPDGFAFTGKWNCDGHFPANGKAHVHHVLYEGRTVSDGKWIEFLQKDIEPAGYSADFSMGYDPIKKEIFTFVGDNKGYAMLAGPPWQGRSLTLTMTGQASYEGYSSAKPIPISRVTYEVKSADVFTVNWEVQEGQKWNEDDVLNCERVADGSDSSSAYLEPHTQRGQKFSNVFSRTIAFRADGFDDVVKRVSGTAEYLVRESSPEKMVAEATVLYDGKPQAKGTAEIKDQGRVSCWDGKCSAATDASGLTYSAAVWGVPPKTLHKGTSWNVVIAQPWELGPAGTETVTVLAIDPAEHSVILQREGNGDGRFEGDGKPVQLTKEGKTYAADVNPGRSHWKGYTTFREGIVISDELLVERPVTMSAKEIDGIAGTQREYILLNAMPSS
jgi:hypothetical protein